jgi:hypothetical protein
MVNHPQWKWFLLGLLFPIWIVELVCECFIYLFEIFIRKIRNFEEWYEENIIDRIDRALTWLLGEW